MSPADSRNRRTESFGAHLRVGRAAWPELALRADDFARHLVALARTGQLLPTELGADLYLACACLHNVPGAARAFEARYLPSARRAIAQIDPSPAFVDDALQVLWEKVLVGHAGRRPKVADYAGRSPLKRWIKAAAIRTAINLRRGPSRSARREATTAAPVGWSPAAPDVEYLKARYKAHVEAAVETAFRGLDTRARTLLRLHYEERLTVDKLGAIYGVGRSTAARWLAAARAALLEETRQELARRLGVNAHEFDSLIAAVRSDLEVSVFKRLESSAR